MENQSKKYFIPLPKNSEACSGYIENYRDYQFVEVEQEVYNTFYRPIWNTWKQAHRIGCCSASDWKRCLGDCNDCAHHCQSRSVVSMDLPLSEDGFTIADTIMDSAPLIEETLVESTRLEELLSSLQAIDPDGRRIAELLMDGKSGREVSTLLGIAHTTYLRRVKKLQKGLADALKNNF